MPVAIAQEGASGQETGPDAEEDRPGRTGKREPGCGGEQQGEQQENARHIEPMLGHAGIQRRKVRRPADRPARSRRGRLRTAGRGRLAQRNQANNPASSKAPSRVWNCRSRATWSVAARLPRPNGRTSRSMCSRMGASSSPAYSASARSATMGRAAQESAGPGRRRVMFRRETAAASKPRRPPAKGPATSAPAGAGGAGGPGRAAGKWPPLSFEQSAQKKQAAAPAALRSASPAGPAKGPESRREPPADRPAPRRSRRPRCAADESPITRPPAPAHCAALGFSSRVRNRSKKKNTATAAPACSTIFVR